MSPEYANRPPPGVGDPIARKQLMVEKARKAAELVWNSSSNKPSMHDDDEQEEGEHELEQYLRWRERVKLKQRRTFFEFFRRSLKQQKAVHWWRYPFASRHCAIKTILCWLLLCFSGLLHFHFLFNEHNRIWPFDAGIQNSAKICLVGFVSIHGVAVVGLWTKAAVLVAPAAAVYTLFAIAGFFNTFYQLLALSIANDDDDIQPNIFSQFDALLLPLVGWTSKLLWETFLMFQWAAKWEKVKAKTLHEQQQQKDDNFWAENCDFHVRKMSLSDHHSALIKWASNKDPQKFKERVVLYAGTNASRYTIVNMPTTEIKLRRRRHSSPPAKKDDERLAEEEPIDLVKQYTVRFGRGAQQRHCDDNANAVISARGHHRQRLLAPVAEEEAVYATAAAPPPPTSPASLLSPPVLRDRASSDNSHNNNIGRI
uniref:Uncharacterized protein n=1 Tax=Globodera rostochiensis TaxID=31243 RepID=A0A914GVK7_GLORO